MAEKNKKFRLRLNSRDGLWALVANRSLAPSRAGMADRRWPRFSLPSIIAAISV
jgi:hypothetical protein